MKRFLFILFLVLTVCVGVVAQESKSENTDEVLIKINVPETDKKVKVYVSKYPNFMGKKLIAEGTGEAYVDNSYQYIGFSKFALQPLVINDKVLEYDVELGNPGLNGLGIASSIVGAISAGAGLGFLLSAGMTSEQEFKKMLPLGISMVGVGATGVTFGLILNSKHKPKLIRVNN